MNSRYSCTASLGRERRTASTVVTILPATSGHSGIDLQEQVNDHHYHGDDHHHHADDHRRFHCNEYDHHSAVMIVVLFRKHFLSLKKSCWSQGEGGEVAVEVVGGPPLR